jgi:hypothetical protein
MSDWLTRGALGLIWLAVILFGAALLVLHWKFG